MSESNDGVKPSNVLNGNFGEKPVKLSDMDEGVEKPVNSSAEITTISVGKITSGEYKIGAATVWEITPYQRIVKPHENSSPDLWRQQQLWYERTSKRKQWVDIPIVIRVIPIGPTECINIEDDIK